VIARLIFAGRARRHAPKHPWKLRIRGSHSGCSLIHVNAFLVTQVTSEIFRFKRPRLCNDSVLNPNGTCRR
jgi:hypothetical protein